MVTRILTLGGHDFTSRPPDRAVSELMLRLATERAGGRPRICLLPTASGDTSEQIGRFYAAFGERPCEPSRPLPLPPRPAADGAARPPARPGPDLRRRRQSASTCSRSGRRTSSSSILSLAWQPGHRPRRPERRRDVLVRGRHHQVLGHARRSEAGLGLLAGSLCVHYNNEPERRAAYLEAVANGMPGGYGLDDYAGLLWEGTAPLSRNRPPRRSRLQGHKLRDRGGRVPASGEIPPSTCPRRPPRGHR